MERKSRAAAILAVILVTSLSLAHEQKDALTDVLYNERTGNLEIAHRLSLHDAEHTVQKTTGLRADLTQSQEAREAFAQYVASHFSLTRGNKSVLDLDLVGQEIDGGYLWVYQETKIPAPTNSPFEIQNTILLDIVKDQTNTVNVRFRKKVSTFVFRSGSGKKLYLGPSTSNKPTKS